MDTPGSPGWYWGVCPGRDCPEPLLYLPDFDGSPAVYREGREGPMPTLPAWALDRDGAPRRVRSIEEDDAVRELSEARRSRLDTLTARAEAAETERDALAAELAAVGEAVGADFAPLMDLPPTPVSARVATALRFLRGQGEALAAELAAMRGERAPEGWSLSRSGTVAQGWEQQAHRETLWVTLERRRNGYGWTHYRNGEGVATGIADRLTGPDGAFAQAEAAAGVDDD